MTWYVYILRCRDDSLYTGITNDLEKRFQKHQTGKASKYTRSRLPVKLVFKWKCASKSEALKIEARLKKLSKSVKEAGIEFVSTLSILH